ncbi:MAG: sensor histidine kinase [Spirosomataceae bacterium]
MKGAIILMVFGVGASCLAQQADTLRRSVLWFERDTSLAKLENQYIIAELEKIQYAKDNALLKQKALQKELENQKLKTAGLQQTLLNEQFKAEVTQHKTAQEQQIKQLQIQQLNQQVVLQDRTRNFLMATVGLLLLLVGASFWYNRRLFRKNKEIQEALLKGQKIERRRVAADLHDNLGGMMSAIRLSIEAMDVSELSPKEKEVYQNVLTMTKQAYNEVRLLSHNLQPEELEKFGLVEALYRLIGKLNTSQKIHFELKSSPLPRLHKELEFNLYSICLELSNNIVKHSGATEAMFELLLKATQIQLFVTDNGKGFIPNNTSDGIGMRNIQERTEQLGGILKIHSEPNEGTLFSFYVPVNPPAHS